MSRVTRRRERGVLRVLCRRVLGSESCGFVLQPAATVNWAGVGKKAYFWALWVLLYAGHVLAVVDLSAAGCGHKEGIVMIWQQVCRILAFKFAEDCGTWRNLSVNKSSLRPSTGRGRGGSKDQQTVRCPPFPYTRRQETLVQLVRAPLLSTLSSPDSTSLRDPPLGFL